MSITMDEGIKRWTARRKSALVLEIIQGKRTVSEASRQFDLAPSEIEEWIELSRISACGTNFVIEERRFSGSS